jgi:hypothetical protein
MVRGGVVGIKFKGALKLPLRPDPVPIKLVKESS